MEGEGWQISEVVALLGMGRRAIQRSCGQNLVSGDLGIVRVGARHRRHGAVSRRLAPPPPTRGRLWQHLAGWRAWRASRRARGPGFDLAVELLLGPGSFARVLGALEDSEE